MLEVTIQNENIKMVSIYNTPTPFIKAKPQRDAKVKKQRKHNHKRLSE